VPDRGEFERELARRIGVLERRYMGTIRKSFERDIEPDPAAIPPSLWEEMRDELAALVSAIIARAAMEYVRENAQPVGVDLADAATAIAAWADEHGRTVSASIVDNTRKLVERAARSARTVKELMERIAVRFSPAHAEQVAITEVTRAISRGGEELQRRLEMQNVRTVRRWLTAEDERVCPVCAPMDHTTFESGAWVRAGLASGPPAHPRCRCWVVVEYVRDGG